MADIDSFPEIINDNQNRACPLRMYVLYVESKSAQLIY